MGAILPADYGHDGGVTELGTVSTAERDALAAADASGVRVVELRDLAGFQLAVDLFESVWGSAPMNRDMLRALGKAGNYVSGAFRGDLLVGACAAFFGPPGGAAMHSHVAAVAPGQHGRHVGFAVKLHQRAWALRRGVTRITWTYDPLVHRNAYFNLAKLGATAAAYLVNFYGPMHDAINGDDESDRLLVDWDLLAPPGATATPDLETLRAQGAVTGLSMDDQGNPVVGSTAGPVVLVGVPPEVETLRRADPAAARAWRYALRTVLGGLLADGGRVTGFARSGWYVVETATARA
jgi:predicted GNAT superfamily acetyltransferase